MCEISRAYLNDKRVLYVNCSSCIRNSSLSNRECLKNLSSEIERSDVVILEKGNYKKMYSNSQIKKILRGKKGVPIIYPSFVSSFVEIEEPKLKKEEEYFVGEEKVTIFRTPSHFYYFVIPKEFSLSQRQIEIASAAINEIRNFIENVSIESFERDVEKKLIEFLSKRKARELIDIVRRNTVGYGVIEILFSDENIQDIYVDSPGDRAVYITHRKFGECVTNIVLGEKEVEEISTKLRALSGRPFDEAFPVLHCDIPKFGIRVCGITTPLTFKGTGYAFRKHNPNPWTLLNFIENEMVNENAAGLLSFLSNNQVSILITGSRGSGKTSLLSSLLCEVPKRNRIIVIEDTPELPVEKLKKAGYNIQHLKVKASFGETESFEISPDEALRTALRLGESILVIGEVRGKEAKTLFEAMRVGAAGNVVMGTIHGSTAYDTWDRIVNDLGVPSTSFKATDIVVSCASLRKGLNIKRKVIEITEVKKLWQKDPVRERGFFSLMKMDKDRELKFNNLKKSEIIGKISNLLGVGVEKIIREIKMRGKMKGAIVNYSKKRRKPELLGIEFSTKANEKINELLYERSPQRAYREFISWLKKF